MATLRSGKKLDTTDNNNEVTDDKKTQKPPKDRTTLVVFFGLLIDLLGIHNSNTSSDCLTKTRYFQHSH